MEFSQWAKVFRKNSHERFVCEHEFEYPEGLQKKDLKTMNG